MSFDLIAFQYIHGFAGASSLLDIAGIFFATYLPYFILISVFLAFILEPDWRRRVYSILFILLAIIFSRGFFVPLINVVFPRMRPFEALGFEPMTHAPQTPSFPSGHAAIFFSLATAVFFLRPKWGVAIGIATFFIGVARVFSGVHWPTDIAGGILVGLISGLLVSEMLSSFAPKKHSQAT